MSKKKTLNLAVPEDLLAEFDQVCAHYGHAKQKGMILSAAILMFLRSDPASQGHCLKEIAVADIESGVAQLVQHIKKEQSLKLAFAEAATQATTNDNSPSRTSHSPQAQPISQANATRPVSPSAKPRKAAKKVTRTKRAVTKLAKIQDLKKRR